MNSTELRAALRVAEAAEAAEAAALRNSIAPVLRHTFVPKPSHHTVWDQTCVVWELRGECTNAAEMAAVGGDANRHTGAMSYLINTLSGHIVMSLGGGRVYIGFNPDSSVLHALSDFAAANPQGGVVSHLI